jgi:hypothetical protein
MLQRFARLSLLFCLLGLFGRPGRAGADDQPATNAAPPTTQNDSGDSDSGTPLEVPDESTRLSLPLFGFSVIPPPYWSRLSEDRPARAALWELHDLGTGQVVGVLGIEASVTPATDAMQIVDHLRRVNHLDFPTQRDDLDGSPAYEVPVPPHVRYGNTHSVRAIVCVHEGLLYYIESSESGAMVMTPRLRQLAKTWKWVPFDALSQHLEFRNAPRALGKYLQIAVPNVLKPPPPEGAAHGILTQVAFDVRYARIEFALDYSTEPRQSGEDFAAACKRIAQELTYSHRTNPPVTVAPRDGTPPRQATNSVAGRLGGTGSAVIARWALVDLSAFGEQSVAEVRFGLASGMPDEMLKAYNATIDKMIDSIAPKQIGVEELPQGPAPKPAAPAGQPPSSP